MDGTVVLVDLHRRAHVSVSGTCYRDVATSRWQLPTWKNERRESASDNVSQGQARPRPGTSTDSRGPEVSKGTARIIYKPRRESPRPFPCVLQPSRRGPALGGIAERLVTVPPRRPHGLVFLGRSDVAFKLVCVSLGASAHAADISPVCSLSKATVGMLIMILTVPHYYYY